MKKNKNLIYNENTKLIEIKTDNKDKLQIFLEQKKIYFETIMMLVLSLAGIIVSIVSVSVAMIANDISLNEQRIEDLEKQPAFILSIETDEQRENYFIKNVGGDIKHGDVFGYEMLIINIYNKQYGYLGKGYIILEGCMEKDFSTYNFETNRFELYSTLESKPVTECVDKIFDLIKSEGCSCSILRTKYFDFMYVDYKQEIIQRAMMLKERGIIIDMEDTGNYEFKIRADIYDLENEQIYDDMREQLKRLLRYNSIF